MEPKELVGLYEAYQQVYEPQELSEEVEIATEYFYEMGLNENGIDILIEELGEEEFVNWVYDIAEEYTLSEATQTRLQRMAAAKGKIIVGPKGSRPQSTTNAAIKKMGGITKKISSSQRPGSTISGKREKAASTAVSQQAPTSSTPQQTRGGIGKAIGGAFNWAKQKAQSDIQQTKKGLQNLGQAWQQASDTKAAGLARGAIVAGSKAIEKHGHAVGKAAGKAAGRAYIAGRELRKSLNREEYEYILEHLLDEGYANTIESAEKIAMNMSENWVLDVLDEATAMAKRGYDETAIRNRIARSTGGGEAADRATALENRPTYGNTSKTQQRQRYARAQRGDFRNTTSSNPGLHGYGHQSNDPEVKAKQAARGAQRGSAALTPKERKQLGR